MLGSFQNGVRGQWEVVVVRDGKNMHAISGAYAPLPTLTRRDGCRERNEYMEL